MTKLKKISSDMYMKTCPTCEKTKVAEFGFYKQPEKKDGFQWECKVCQRKRDNESYKEKVKGVYQTHKWEDTDSLNIQKCVRCGVERKRTAHPYKPGKWNYKFLAPGDHSLCVTGVNKGLENNN